MKTIDKNLIKRIKKLCGEIEEFADSSEPDKDTIEGEAYSILQEILSVANYNDGYFPITSVSREDLGGIGFDTAKVDDADMEHLASKMADSYCDCCYWDALKILAEESEIPKKSTLNAKNKVI